MHIYNTAINQKTVLDIFQLTMGGLYIFILRGLRAMTSHSNMSFDSCLLNNFDTIEIEKKIRELKLYQNCSSCYSLGDMAVLSFNMNK